MREEREKEKGCTHTFSLEGTPELLERVVETLVLLFLEVDALRFSPLGLHDLDPFACAANQSFSLF